MLDVDLESLPLISLIVARGRNGVIGAEGDLPFRLKRDMRHFVDVTRGKPVIMGRKTWVSLPKRPLPGRANLVVSRDTGFDAEGARVAPSLGVALAMARSIAQAKGLDQVMVIGGAQIYRATLDQAHRLYLTDVDAEPVGDALFPEIDESQWREVKRESQEADADNEHSFDMRLLERCEAAG